VHTALMLGGSLCPGLIYKTSSYNLPSGGVRSMQQA
jgi:hypothetical protein